MRFKIDIYDSTCRPFGLYHMHKTWTGRVYWVFIDAFETRDKAKEFYETIKDLPEYLP